MGAANAGLRIASAATKDMRWVPCPWECMLVLPHSTSALKGIHRIPPALVLAVAAQAHASTGHAST